MAPIVGSRFKCTVRSDYDLCGKCKKKDETEYPMVEFVAPRGTCRDWKGAKDFRKELKRAAEKKMALYAAEAKKRAAKATKRAGAPEGLQRGIEQSLETLQEEMLAKIRQCMEEKEVEAKRGEMMEDLKTKLAAHNSLNANVEQGEEVEATGATLENLDQLRLATMASLESLPQDWEVLQKDEVQVLASPSEDGTPDEKVEEPLPTEEEEEEVEPSLKPGHGVQLHSLNNDKFNGRKGFVKEMVGDKVVVELGAPRFETVLVKAKNTKPGAVPAKEEEEGLLATLADMGFVDKHGVEAVQALLNKAKETGMPVEEIIESIISTLV